MHESTQCHINHLHFNLMRFSPRDYYHCIRVKEVAGKFCEKLALTKNECENIAYAGSLHDIGKIHINPDILFKNGKLTNNEFDEIKKHTTEGVCLLNKGLFTHSMHKLITDVISEHHEQCNGKGYPNHKSADNINFASKVVALCDVFDALSSKRHYKHMYCKVSTRKILTMQAEKFDNELLEVFLAHFDELFAFKEIVYQTQRNICENLI